MKALRDELQADIDLEDDPRYAAMFAAVQHRLGTTDLRQALYRPESILRSKRGFPLYGRELSELSSALGVSVHAKTIERMAADGLLSPSLKLGSRQLARPIYFARHLIEVLFEQLMVDLKPERQRAYLAVLAGRLTEAERLYFSGLPGVRRDLLEASEDSEVRRQAGVLWPWLVGMMPVAGGTILKFVKLWAPQRRNS